MKLSNDANIISNIFITLLFLLGIMILLKVGVYHWIVWCHILYFSIIRDENFIEMIKLNEPEQDIYTYALLWIFSLIMPVTLLLMYLLARFTGYSMDDHE
jgi:hypothetical protein